MEKKFVYVVKVVNKDGSVTYVGDHQSITDPWSYQLFGFAYKYGFATEDEAIAAPVSFLNDGNAEMAKVIPLEVW